MIICNNIRVIKMKKIFKRIWAYLLIIVMFSNTTNVFAGKEENVNNTDLIKGFSFDLPGIYPVTPDDSAWKEIGFEEQLELTCVPDEIAKNSSTEQLVQWVLNYPFLIDMFAFDDFEDAINHFKFTNNAFRYLDEKEDFLKCLLNEYKATDIYSNVAEEEKKENDLLLDEYIKELFMLECFSLYSEKMSEDDYLDLRKEILTRENFRKMFYPEWCASNVIPDTIDEITGNNANEIVNATSTTGFVVTGSTHTMYFGDAGTTTTIPGNYYLYGTYAPCEKYVSGDFSATVYSEIDSDFMTLHPTFVKQGHATKKYNCHSYAWISANTNNQFWMNNPTNYINSSYFSHISHNGSCASGDRIVIYTNDSSVPAHSAISNTNGSNMTAISSVISKLGCEGLYITTLTDLMLLYSSDSGNYYEVYR